MACSATAIYEDIGIMTIIGFWYHGGVYYRQLDFLIYTVALRLFMYQHSYWTHKWMSGNTTYVIGNIIGHGLVCHGHRFCLNMSRLWYILFDGAKFNVNHEELDCQIDIEIHPCVINSTCSKKIEACASKCRIHSMKPDEACIAVCGSLACNRLLKEITLCDEIEAIKRNLKTDLFVKFVNGSIVI